MNTSPWPNNSHNNPRALYDNALVNIVGERRHYLRIERNDGSTSWVESSAVQDISPREAQARSQAPPPGTFVPIGLGDPPRSARIHYHGRDRLFSEFSESDTSFPRYQQRSFALHAKSKSKKWGRHDCENAFDACKLGRLPELRALIEKGVPVTSTPYGNESLAYLASYCKVGK